MKIKIFTKRHNKALSNGQLKIYLSSYVRRRLWDAMKDHNIQYSYSPNPLDNWINHTSILGEFEEIIRKEHGWPELRAYQSKNDFKKVNLEGFIIEGVPRFIMDAVELFYDEMVLHEDDPYPKPLEFQKSVNVIFEDANLPWRMSEGRIFQVDSKFLEEEVTAKAQELINKVGFEGALDEFLRARSDIDTGDTKGAIAKANLALESTMKAILKVEKIKPGELVRNMIDSGLIPEYFEKFLISFEQILRCVPVARSDEKGVGHGQGEKINVPPVALAKLAIHLSASLIIFLIERYIEKKDETVSESTAAKASFKELEDDIPF